MQHVAEYLQHAGECLSMASSARSERLREQLVELAKQWTVLAAQREQLLRAKSDGEFKSRQ